MLGARPFLSPFSGLAPSLRAAVEKLLEQHHTQEMLAEGQHVLTKIPHVRMLQLAAPRAVVFATDQENRSRDVHLGRGRRRHWESSVPKSSVPRPLRRRMRSRDGSRDADDRPSRW